MTEAIQICYDPSRTSYTDLLDIYWSLYGGSSGKPQYKSAIWYHNEAQRLSTEQTDKLSVCLSVCLCLCLDFLVITRNAAACF